MNNAKNVYLIALMFLGFLLYVQWQKDYGQEKEENNITTELDSTIEQSVPVVESDIPKPTQSLNSDTSQPFQTHQKKNTLNIISEVETPLFKLKFSAQGAALVYVELKKYPVNKGSNERVVLFDYTKNSYQAETGLLAVESTTFSHNLIYSTSTNQLNIDSGEQQVIFSASDASGQVEKVYTIKAEGYDIGLTQRVINKTDSDWLMSEYHQIKRNNPWLGKDPSFTDSGRYSFKGAAYFDSEDGYEKFDFDELEEENIKTTVGPDPWVGMIQHYFFSAVIPEADRVEVQSEYRKNSTTPYLIRYITPQKTVTAGSKVDFNSTIYVGPKLQNKLPEVAKGLDLTVDYGIFTAIAKPLFWVLDKIHNLVGNWGWSIILLTILIKLLFFKLSEAQYKSMAKMRKLTPRISTLKERYKDNRQKFNEEMMKLYQQEKVNPMGGCLPILVQIPVFIALYWVLLESVELRQAPFMLWLQDLSSPDPYFILPAINAAAMIMTQRLSPAPGMDPLQQKIMKIMPVAFSVLFAFFQSGLVLYWAVNSVLSLAQQWFITKRIDAQENA